MRTMIWRVRRVLTGHDANGKSIFIADGEAPNVKEMASMPGLALTDLWETTGSPASNDGNEDAAVVRQKRDAEAVFTAVAIGKLAAMCGIGDGQVERERPADGQQALPRRRQQH